jgi:mannose-6-phosphate isomerase-like protein (cupin superfamily)
MDINIVAAGSGRSISLGPSAQFHVKEDGSHTRGNLMVAEMVIQPEFAAPVQHLHRAHEESWFILEGEVEFTSGTRVSRVGPGGWVLVPIGVPHTFGNPGKIPARFLAVMTPNLYLNYFVEVAKAMGRAGRDGIALTDEKRAQITSQIMSKYQTEVVDAVAWERDHPPHTH